MLEMIDVKFESTAFHKRLFNQFDWNETFYGRN
jgi:hypothetical protein